MVTVKVEKRILTKKEIKLVKKNECLVWESELEEEDNDE